MLWALIAVGIFGLFAVWPSRPRGPRGGKGKDVPRPLRGSWVVKEDQGRRLWSAELAQRGLDTAGLVPFGAFSAHLGCDLGEFPSRRQLRNARCGTPSNSRTCCCRGVRSASKV